MMPAGRVCNDKTLNARDCSQSYTPSPPLSARVGGTHQCDTVEAPATNKCADMTGFVRMRCTILSPLATGYLPLDCELDCIDYSTVPIRRFDVMGSGHIGCSIDGVRGSGLRVMASVRLENSTGRNGDSEWRVASGE